MFDFAWSEIALIGGVALVLIGPKDMPVAIKAVTTAIKKARRMAAEFQTHVDDLVRDADLHEVRDGIRSIRGMDIRGTIARAVDSDGSIRRTLNENPLNDVADPVRPAPPVVTTPEVALPDAALPEHAVAALPEHAIAAPAAVVAPAFIPPAEMVLAPPPVQAPAFIPPDAAARGPAHGA